MMRSIKFIFVISIINASCTVNNPFTNNSDYRTFPIAVDCNKASDVNLTYQKTGMPTLHFDQNNIEFTNISGEHGELRPICILKELSLLQFCQYKGPEEVAPYWVAAYQKINTVKCKEILK